MVTKPKNSNRIKEAREERRFMAFLSAFILFVVVESVYCAVMTAITLNPFYLMFAFAGIFAAIPFLALFGNVFKCFAEANKKIPKLTLRQRQLRRKKLFHNILLGIGWAFGLAIIGFLIIAPIWTVYMYVMTGSFQYIPVIGLEIFTWVAIWVTLRDGPALV